MVFAINDKNSFEETKQLRESLVNLRSTTKVPIVVCGNKCDMESTREIDKETATRWSQSIKAPYFETSAKVNINVAESFQQLVREIWRYKQKTGSNKKQEAKKGCIIL